MISILIETYRLDFISNLWSDIKLIFILSVIVAIIILIVKAVISHKGKNTLYDNSAEIDYVVMNRKKVDGKKFSVIEYDAVIYLKDGTKKYIYDVLPNSMTFQKLKELAINDIRHKKWADNFEVRRCPTCHRVLKYNEKFCKQCYVKATTPSSDSRVSHYDQYLERRKMSASLRYDVFKRDGCKCKICGATADDGVKLHVDHIIPVSKGGKTEMDNLQTLCERCNLGKSNKL